MSKKDNQPDMSYGTAYVVSANFHERLFGKLCEVVEAVGFDSKQEEAIKNLIRKSMSSVLDNSLYITSEEHNDLREKHKGQGQLTNPIGA